MCISATRNARNRLRFGCVSSRFRSCGYALNELLFDAFPQRPVSCVYVAFQQLRFLDGFLCFLAFPQISTDQESSLFCRILIFSLQLEILCSFNPEKCVVFSNFSSFLLFFLTGTRVSVHFRRNKPMKNPLYFAGFWYFLLLLGISCSYKQEKCIVFCRSSSFLLFFLTYTRVSVRFRRN